jgi:DNA repair exonuclease SbcCD nuclease subunit
VPQVQLPDFDPETHFRLVATADWQLDMVGGSLGAAGAELLRDARIESVATILRVAESVGAQAVLAAGDLFEFPRPSDDTITAVAQVLQRHRAVPIHAIPGNHDLDGPGTVWRRPEIAAVSHLTVHVEDDRVALSEGVWLHSLPVRSKHDTNPQHERLAPFVERSEVHIVMAHGHDTAFLDMQHEDCKLPINSSAVIDRGYALLVLGHWHSWNEVNARVLYPGTHEQTKFNEKDAGNIAIIDLPLDGGEPTFHRHRVGKLNWQQIDFDCSNQELPEDLIERGRVLSEEADFLEVTLTGEVSLKDTLEALPYALDAVKTMVGHLRYQDQTRQRVDLEAALEDVPLAQGLRQVQETLMGELVHAGDDSAAADLIRAELEVLYESNRDVVSPQSSLPS